MNTANSIKCMAALIKTIKVIKCVKKAEIGVIVSVIILIGFTAIRDNRAELMKTVKKLKKKVM